MRRLILAVICVLILGFTISSARADELDDINKKLEDLKRTFNDLKKATDTNQATLNKLNEQLNGIKLEVAQTEKEISIKEKEVKTGEKALGYQTNLLHARVRSYYKNISKASFSLISILVEENLSVSLRNFFYQKTLTDEDKNTIIKIVRYIKELEDKKTKLQSEKDRLLVIKKDVDQQSQFLAGEVTKARKYESELQQEIAVLSARQQQIVSQRQSSLNIPRSAGTSTRGCSDDRSVDPGFSPRLAFFTFGAPHRVGMNQYGAKGRAEDGQNSEAILRAYFNFDEIKDVSTDTNIRVDGVGEFKLEEYMKGIREMPESWPPEALRAQAIAARSYVMAYTNNGSGSICNSENCQVFNPPGDRNDGWTQAVEATQGKVMAQGGNPIKAWFASTHGGYVFSSAEVWGGATSFTKHATDTKTGSASSFDDLQNNAYDRSSPWFYCDWGSRSSYSNTAWLKTSEVADIANAILLARRDSSTGDHLYQTDKAHPYGGEVWSEERVKQELRNKGGVPYNNVTDVSIGVDFGSGKTTTITVSGDAGSTSFDAAEFKNWFNIRAPANIQIVGPLFNVEKR